MSQNTSHLLENLKPNTKYVAFVRAYTNFPSDQSDRLVFSTAEDGKLGMRFFFVRLSCIRTRHKYRLKKEYIPKLYV